MSRLNNKWDRLKREIIIGEIIEGIVVDIKPYGVLVDVGFKIEEDYRFSGIIDMISIPIHGVRSLPVERTDWPEVNDKIRCLVIGYREHNFEVDVGLCA